MIDKGSAPGEYHGGRRLTWLGATLLAFTAVVYGPSLTMPFIGDDYVFIDETRAASFWSLWSFKNSFAHWYRPWSRELHFWLLQRLVGLHPPGFRIFGFALWLASLGLFTLIVRRLSTVGTAAIAAVGVACLALWGTPLLWISGSQDLWMLLFCLASLYASVRGKHALALPAFALALLSKETAAVLPSILFAYLVFVEARRPSEALRLVFPFVTVTLVWFLFHPTLRTRLFSGIPIDRELETRPGIAVVLLKTVLSVINCDAVPRPSEVSSGYVVRTIISALVLAGGLYATLRSDATRDVAKGQPRDFTGAHKFAVAWAILAWLPLVLPSIAWHAYYGCLGALGAWFAVALWLRQFPSTAVGLVVVLCILRGAQASTPSWNWGDEWYQRRAGNLLESIRRDLIRLHPTLPSHSRVFFGHIPNNIGLIAGQSPALRVWYRDSTLQAGFYSSYAPRVGSARNGTDYFFRFDSLDGMVEVRKGPENIEEGKQANPDWEADHEKLAMLFLSNGDVPGAAVEFEKLSRLPERADAASYAAVCYLVLGDSIRADSLAGASAIRLGLSRAEMEQRLAALRASMPGR